MVPKAAIPKPAEIARETIIVIAGAILAAAIIGQLPAVRDWIKRQWGGDPPQAW
ncbi:MAG TPA: hypothetical protein VNO84_11685 [Burkholderiaceae bacterium]|nr:hypothetical protein [Burkholderiaceae bacterium]